MRQTRFKFSLTLSLASGENVTLQTKVYPKNLLEDLTSTYKNFQDTGFFRQSYCSHLGGGTRSLKIFNLMNSKGISVLFLVIAMMLMVTIGYVFSYLIPTKQKSVKFPIYSTQAFYIAQSGVEFAIRYAQDQGWRGATDNVSLISIV